MKNWQKTIVTLAAVIYLDKEIIPWALEYIVHWKDMIQVGEWYGQKYGVREGVKHLVKDTLDAYKEREES